MTIKKKCEQKAKHFYYIPKVNLTKNTIILIYMIFFIYLDSFDENIESLQSPSKFFNEINYNSIEILKVTFLIIYPQLHLILTFL